jgi:hypothetical protein
MLCFQNVFVFILENVPLSSAIKRRFYLISCLKALSPWRLGLNIYSNFNLSVSRTVKSVLMLAVTLAAEVTWGHLRRGNEEQCPLDYRLRPVSSSSYAGERAKNVERRDRVCFKAIFRPSTKRLMKSTDNLN